MKKGVIFDLDQTLVDSSSAEPYRGKNWSKACSLIPEFKLYNGFSEVFEYIINNDIKVVIVSTSVSFYVNKVVKHFNVPCNRIIAYHDVSRRKPDPECMNQALCTMSLTAEDVISFGDRVIDIQASNAAKIKSVACLWGTLEASELVAANPSYTIRSPLEIIKLCND